VTFALTAAGITSMVYGLALAAPPIAGAVTRAARRIGVPFPWPERHDKAIYVSSGVACFLIGVLMIALAIAL
jgi:hypothetical protein